jgi:hypothetical protein
MNEYAQVEQKQILPITRQQYLGLRKDSRHSGQLPYGKGWELRQSKNSLVMFGLKKESLVD